MGRWVLGLQRQQPAENFSPRAMKCFRWVSLRGLLTADAEMTSGISQEAGVLL